MAKRLKRKKSKVVLDIGSRVKHAIDKTLDEGVIVHKFGNGKPVTDKNSTTWFVQWSVHWSNGKRGVYYGNDITKIKAKTAIPAAADEED